MIDLLFDPDQLEFRDQVRTALQAGSAKRDPWLFFRGRGPEARRLYQDFGARGWLTQSWPVEQGGAADPVRDFFVWDELAYARAARIDLGSTIVAKTLMSHGSQQQRERFLDDIRLAKIAFSLGYSEPEAGSDLGGLRTRAVRDGDVYRVTGEKRWTSDAHNADYLWLLARTGKLEDRARSLTFLIVDAKSPGISMRPIPLLDGHHVNEVRLHDVEVPVDNRVGAENEAWPLMREALAHERHLQALPGRVRRDYEDLMAWAQTPAVRGDSVVQSRLVEFGVRLLEIESLAVSLLTPSTAGDWATKAAAVKLMGTTLLQRIARTPSELGYRSAFVKGDPFEFLWRECILETVGAGTVEIMRTIAARQSLGLSSQR